MASHVYVIFFLLCVMPSSRHVENATFFWMSSNSHVFGADLCPDVSFGFISPVWCQYVGFSIRALVDIFFISDAKYFIRPPPPSNCVSVETWFISNFYL